jgi:membrane peptidoglycan carboxypeptidase
VDLWLWEELARLREFRVRVSLAYIARLAGTAGVRTQLVPVLSLPLGASEVSLLEMALLYQGMWLSGRSRFFADPLVLAGGPIPPALQVGPPPETPAFSIISEIYLADGRLIYRTARQIEPTQPGELGAELASMLRAVVLHGTGTRAEGAVRPGNEASEQRWLPIFGKTGTTNSYRNAAFVGFVPTADPTDGALRPGVGMTVATYVGYDDNREMRRGGARLMGASAALPIWIATAQAIGTGVRLPPAAIDEQPGAVGLIWPDNVGAVTVRATDGLPAVGGETEGLAELRVPARGPSFAPVAMLLPAPAEPDVEDGGAQPEATPDPGPDDPSGEGETPSGEGAIEPGTAPSAAPGDPAGPHGGTR